MKDGLCGQHFLKTGAFIADENAYPVIMTMWKHNRKLALSNSAVMLPVPFVEINKKLYFWRGPDMYARGSAELFSAWPTFQNQKFNDQTLEF